MKKAKIRLSFVFVFLFSVPVLGLAEMENSRKVNRQILDALLPGEREIFGLKKSSEIRFYTPTNLWEYINGQAVMYLDYGFQGVVTKDYSTETYSMNIEVYQMESPLHAFGIYAAERSPEDNYIQIPAEGYTSGNALNFWNGPYYVKLIIFEESPSLKKALLETSRKIAKKIGGSYSEPELFAIFPIKNRIIKSERFTPKNFLGQPYLKNGHRVDYRKNRIRFQIFLAESGSSEEARGAFAKYENFFQSDGSRVSSKKKRDYQVFKVTGKKQRIIFQFKTLVGGVQNIEHFSTGEKIIEEMVKKLRQLGQFSQ